MGLHWTAACFQNTLIVIMERKEANFLEVGMNNTTDESNLLSLKAVMRVMKGLVAITMVIRLMIRVNFLKES